jgi:hypothetical protein
MKKAWFSFTFSCTMQPGELLQSCCNAEPMACDNAQNSYLQLHDSILNRNISLPQYFFINKNKFINSN